MKLQSIVDEVAHTWKFLHENGIVPIVDFDKAVGVPKLLRQTPVANTNDLIIFKEFKGSIQQLTNASWTYKLICSCNGWTNDNGAYTIQIWQVHIVCKNHSYSI